MLNFNKIKGAALKEASKMGLDKSGMSDILENRMGVLGKGKVWNKEIIVESVGNKFSTLSPSKIKELSTEHGGKVKDFIVENKEELKEKIYQNKEIREIFISKALAMVSAPLITSFLYTLLPSPIQWVLPESVFAFVVEDNLAFIIDTLFIVGDNAEDIVDVSTALI
jgi:hypothetical protein